MKTLLAVCLGLSLGACTGASPNDPPEGVDTVAPAGAAPAPDSGGLKPELYPACNASEMAQAVQACNTNHPGYEVTSCGYNAATGYIVYTYALDYKYIGPLY